MKGRFIVCTVCLVMIATIADAAVSAEQFRAQALAALAERSLTPPRVLLHPEPGAAYVSATLPSTGKDSVAASLDAIEAVKGLWGLADPRQQLAVREVIHDGLGFEHVVFEQKVGSVPVYHAWLVGHRAPGGAIVALNGRVTPSAPQTPAIPTIGAAEATKRALAALPWAIEPSRSISPALVYVPWRGSAVLAWRFDLPTLSPRPARFQVAIDAVTGETLEVWDAFATVTASGSGCRGTVRQFEVTADAAGYIMQDGTRGDGIYTYDAASGQSRGMIVRSATTTFDQPSHAAAVDAHAFAELVYDMYRTLGRNSLDNNGMYIISTVHYGQNYENAGWTGVQMVYGDGDPETEYPYSCAPDVVAHELTHAVTDFTVQLEYWGQSGALNEALSDIFGYFADPEDWLMGEDIFRTAGAIRSFEDPAAYNQPANMDQFIYTRSDNLGVHYNSGVINHAFYHQVQQLGTGRLADLAKLYYRLMEGRYVTPTADFWDFRAGMEQAARDLFGESSEILDAVNDSYDEVGVSGQPRALSTMFVPTAASNTGLAGSHWVTDLRVHNAGSQSAGVTVWYSVSGNDWYPANTPPKKTYTIEPGATLALSDIVAAEFAKPETKGGIELRPGRDTLLVGSRTYNLTSNGTYGQYVGGVDGAAGPTPDMPHEILMLSGGGRYRSNVGFQETAGSEGFVDLFLLDANGAQLAKKTLYLGPWQHRQEELFAFVGAQPAQNCRLEVKPRGTFSVAAYGSVIDNVSNDAVYVPALRPSSSGGPLIVPAVIRKGGFAGALWRTDLFLANLRSQAADVTFRFTPHTGGDQATATRTVAAGQTLELADVAAALYSLDGVQGQLEVVAGDGSADGLLVTSRTYTIASTNAGEASFGQFVPALPARDALRPGETAYLPFLTGGSGFRTNLGLLETAGEPAAARVELLKSDGSVLTTLTKTLRPREWFQFLRVLDGMDLGASTAAAARITLTSTGGRLVAYASVVDNITNDPINVPMAFPVGIR